MISLHRNVNKTPQVETGYSHFFAGDYLSDTGAADDADFGYVSGEADLLMASNRINPAKPMLTIAALFVAALCAVAGDDGGMALLPAAQ